MKKKDEEPEITWPVGNTLEKGTAFLPIRKEKKTPSSEPLPIKGLSANDLEWIRKRQEWRIRIARQFLKHYLSKPADEIPSDLYSGKEREEIRARFQGLTEEIERDLSRLLIREFEVFDLEKKRLHIIDFLEGIIQTLRGRAQARTGFDTPLMILEQDRQLLEREIMIAIEDSGEDQSRLAEYLTCLAELHRELERQRKRIRLLLGTDRKIGNLYPSNEQIMRLRIDELWERVDMLGGLMRHLSLNLADLLAEDTPYPRLKEQLTTVRLALKEINHFLVKPFVAVYEKTRSMDLPLRDMERSLASLSDDITTLRNRSLTPFFDGEPDRGSQEFFLKIYHLLTELLKIPNKITNLDRNLMSVLLARVEDLPPHEVSFDSDVLIRMLKVARQHFAGLMKKVLNPAIKTLTGMVKDFPENGGQPEELVHRIDKAMIELEKQVIEPLRARFRDIREDNALELKRVSCSTAGKIRSFLQDSFSRVAAVDPRSHKEPEYFFRKEFSKEFKRDMELHKKMSELYLYLQRLDLSRIERLASLEAEECHPTGIAGREILQHAEALRGNLVPYIQDICLMPGLWQDDRRELFDFAARLSDHCTALKTLFTLEMELEKETEHEVSEPREMDPAWLKMRRMVLKALTRIAHLFKDLVTYVGLMSAEIGNRETLFMGNLRPDRVEHSLPA